MSCLWFTFISVTSLTFFHRLRKKGTPEEAKKLSEALSKRKAQLNDIEQVLPKPNGLYLKIILGRLNVSILNKNDRYLFSAN